MQSLIVYVAHTWHFLGGDQERGSRDALAARRTLTAAVSSDDMTGISRATSRMLSIRRSTLRDGSRRRHRLDSGHGGDLWASSGRAS